MGRIFIKTVLLASLLAGGCATRNDLIVLLPNKEGKTGTLVVSNATGETVLNSPYASAAVKSDTRVVAAVATPQEIKEEFGKALASQPARPVSFILYFIEGEDTLTAESKPVVPQIFDEIAHRPAPEVVVIGHTDTVGTMQYNDNLSLQRAEKVRDELVKLGIAADRIQIAGRGKREPLIKTLDGSPEPRNRRVEISVR